MKKKEKIVALIAGALSHSHEVLLDAARTAHRAATDSENIPDNKYDTLSLEASYVAQGQANRAQEIRGALESYRHLEVRGFSADSAVRLTALVTLEDEEGTQKRIFLGPAAGGLRISDEAGEITVITPHSPLGRQILGREVGDVVQVDCGGSEREYEIVEIS
ncbi:GreA/GreB family elongation factor [Geomonas sp. RF6]|uniref:GreA/GreB family elongation factor n=1 Tax=Geomonas sp. RF6 TaxID=2897342 RepID=UPI001E2EA659|nr:GreA/GreB family elongation factor [Geomonas sp. RF6]UFS68775.1 GreA/GreB family elongation factor [Geomonas sp. RF6]